MAPKSVKKAAAKKTAKVMHEWKAGTLHSGKGGPVVKSRKQAIAIAMSEAGMKMKAKPAAKKAAPKKSSVKETYKSPMAKKMHEKKESPKKKAMERKRGGKS